MCESCKFLPEFCNPFAAKGNQLSPVIIFSSKTILMKGNKELLTTLNSLLADELIAINPYLAHSVMCENWENYYEHVTRKLEI